MTRDLLVENIRHATDHEQPLTLSVVEVAVLNAELARLNEQAGYWRAEAQRLQRIVDGGAR